MAVRTLKLTLAERQMVSILVAEPRDGKIDSARMVRHVREKLELRQSMRLLNRVNKQLKEYELPELGWEDLSDPSSLLEQVKELLSRATVAEEQRELETLLDMIRGIQQAGEQAGEYTLDDVYLTWLRDLIVDKDWLKPQKVRQDGHVEEVTPVAPSALLETFADVADIVSSALANEDKKADVSDPVN